MTLPANLRINVPAPFPATVKGTAGIGISRANGIWTVGLAYTQFGVQVPPAANYPTDYVLVWDSVAQTFFTVPLSDLGGAGMQRSVTDFPVVINSTDQILHLNLTTTGTITLPPYQTRSGLPLVFKDVGLQAAANPVTINAASGEFIDRLFPSMPLSTNGQSIRLVPANDGVNTGWFSE